MSIVIENMRQKDIRPPPCEIDYKNFKFLITDRPTDQTMQNYIQVRNSDYCNHKVVAVYEIICDI